MLYCWTFINIMSNNIKFMRRLKIYWFITIVFIGSIIFLMTISINHLYNFERDNFSASVNDLMFLSVHDLKS